MNQTFQDAEITYLEGPTDALKEMKAPGRVLECGLGYIKSGEDFIPIHLESGYPLSLEFCSQNGVEEFLKKIAPLTDWNRQGDDLRQDEVTGAIVLVAAYEARQQDFERRQRKHTPDRGNNHV